MTIEILLYIIIFLYGIVLGSFLNVLIYRLPKHENISTERSHCMTCGHKLGWYDLVPLFSWVFLGGKCRYCKSKISKQYPLVEAINGFGYVLIFWLTGFSLSSICYCLAFSIFLVISVIDYRTQEIPFGLNVCLFIIAVIRLAFNFNDWLDCLIGMVAVSGFMYLCLIIGRAIKGIDAFGGGDIKMMFATGLLIGWKANILAFLLGCIFGAVIHSIRMKVSKDTDHVLAFGPYLCMGLVIAMLFGNAIISWYFGIMNISI